MQASASAYNNVTLISQGNSTTGQYGIAHAGNIGNWLANNTIKGFGFTGTIWSRGAFSDVNGNDYVQCNIVRHIGRCYEFNGPHSGLTRWLNNDIINGNRGLSLSNSGAIGTQWGYHRPSDNRWLGEFGYSWLFYAQTYAENSVATGSKLYVRNNNLTYDPVANYNIGTGSLAYTHTTGTNQSLFYSGTPLYYPICESKATKVPIGSVGISLGLKPFPSNNQSVGTWIAQYSLWRSIWTLL
jgi:hypothetical protein